MGRIDNDSKGADCQVFVYDDVGSDGSDPKWGHDLLGADAREINRALEAFCLDEPDLTLDEVEEEWKVVKEVRQNGGVRTIQTQCECRGLVAYITVSPYR